MLRNILRHMTDVYNLPFTVTLKKVPVESCPVGHEKSIKSLFMLKIGRIF